MVVVEILEIVFRIAVVLSVVPVVFKVRLRQVPPIKSADFEVVLIGDVKLNSLIA
jgi:hypothetical protein